MTHTPLRSFVPLTLLAICPVASADLISHWKLNEALGSATAFDAVGTRDGLVVNAVFHPAGGIAGGAVEIRSASDAYITMHDVLPMTGNVPFTVAGWIKTGSTQHGAPFGRHMSTQIGGYFVAINTSGPGSYGLADKAYFYQSNGAASASPVSTTTINDDQWHHVAATYSPGGNSTLYVDGAPAQDAKSSAPILSSSGTFALGAITFPGLGPKNFYDGFIDDVQVYDESLCSYDIDWLFNHPGEPLPDVVCSADCDDNCTLNVFDYICFGNAYASNDPYADCDGNSTFNIFDYICFGNHFAAGCAQ